MTVVALVETETLDELPHPSSEAESQLSSDMYEALGEGSGDRVSWVDLKRSWGGWNMKPLPESGRRFMGGGETDETSLAEAEETVETSDGAVVASETVDRPSSSGRRVGGGRETDRFRVRAVDVVLGFLELSSDEVFHESDLFLGGLPRIVRAMAVSCCLCCSYCDSGSKGRRAGAGFVAVFCDDFLILK